LLETYAVLTRMPSGLAVAAAAAAGVLARRFDEPLLRLGDADASSVLGTLAEAGVWGGASYDGLIAMEARTHGHTLLTLDERAQATYRRLGISFTVIRA